MTDLKRWTQSPPEEPVEQRAAALFREGLEAEPWDELAQARLKRNVLAQLSAPTRQRALPVRLAVAVSLLAAAGLAAVLTQRSRPVGLASHMITSPDTQVQIVPASRAGDDDQLSLMRGLVNVHGADPKRTLHVRTPHLDARVEASSYFIEVAGEQTTLFIIEGEAWVGETLRMHLLSGQSIRSNDPRLRSPAVEPVLPIPTPAAAVARTETPDPCAHEVASDARFDCYLQLSMGTDQVAQNALFELGVIESEERHDGPSAIVSWGAYLKRFPQGSLAPEAYFSVLSEYLAERRGSEALGVATRFLELYPSDPRTEEVRLATARFACSAGDQAGRALSLLGPLLARGGEDTRGEALFVEGTCQAQLGRRAEALLANQTYVTEFPTGPHAIEAKARLASN